MQGIETMKLNLHSVYIVIFCVISLFSKVANAEGDNGKLDKVLSQITSVKTDITQKERQQTSVKQQLSALKKKIGILAAELNKTNSNLKQQKNSLSKLTKDQAREQSKLKEAQNRLLSQIDLAYQLEHKNYFKVILRSERKITPRLLLSYHKYIFIARLHEMHNIKKALERLEKNRLEIKQQTQKLEKLEKKQVEQKVELEAAKRERNQVLDSLKNRIAEQNKRLKQLLTAKRKLENLVSTLVPHKFAMSSELKTKFCRKFVWPTKGEVAVHFGSPIEQSSWKWSGVIIKATEGQDVQATSAGKVVYADRLAGYGLLLIIDHGNGYMSLYGHNKGFSKKLHEPVAAGEVVATVGKSDSEEAGLYFAIRYNGKPMDPERWCR